MQVGDCHLLFVHFIFETDLTLLLALNSWVPAVLLPLCLSSWDQGHAPQPSQIPALPEKYLLGFL